VQKNDSPLARSSHSVTVVGNKAYIFGGEHHPRTPIDALLHSYEFATNTWNVVSAAGAAPCPRIGHTAAAVGSSIYIFGGRSAKEVGEGSMNDIHRFDTETSAWTPERVQGSTPPARSFHAMTSDSKRYIYLFGGCGEGGRLRDLFVYDTQYCKWQQLPSSDSVVGRGGAGLVATADGCKLYIVAGFCGRELNDVHTFDLKTHTWDSPSCCSREKELPPRSVFGIACLANRIVLYGGEIDPSTKGHDGAGGFSSDVFIFSESEKGWEKETVHGEPPVPRGWFAACASGQALLVHGGNSGSNVRLDDMYLLHTMLA